LLHVLSVSVSVSKSHTLAVILFDHELGVANWFTTLHENSSLKPLSEYIHHSEESIAFHDLFVSTASLFYSSHQLTSATLVQSAFQ